MADTTANTGTAAKQHDISMLVFPPIVHVVWGLVLIGGFILGMMMQIQSTEAWMLGESTQSLVPDFSIFQQFPDFISRHMAPGVSVAFLVAWSVELIYITLKIGTARPRAHAMRKYGVGTVTDAVVRSAAIRAAIWSVVSWGIFLFNAFTDWQYATSLGGWQQVAWIIVVGATTFYAGTHGIQQLSAGVSGMKN
jgi:hypothetical protein